MSSTKYTPRIAIYGSEKRGHLPHRGCSLWSAGYDAVVAAAGGGPEPLFDNDGKAWDEILEAYDGLVFAESLATTAQMQAGETRMIEACRELNMPLLAVDTGMHALNAAFGGTIYQDIPREIPLALQHQHLPEEGDRHAINVLPGTQLARFYGEGEIVVNSEHRQAVCKVGRGFLVSGRALDGVVEAIESEMEGWFSIGVQWHPASPSASGLDIQLFRGFLEACAERRIVMLSTPLLAAA